MITPYGYKTWIEDEERAYNTYHGSHSRSNRRAGVMFPDGRVRIVRVGVADTYFTIPAHGRIRGKYTSGFVDHDNELLCLRFNPSRRD